MRRIMILVTAFVLGLLLGHSSASAEVLAVIELSEQRMTVKVDGAVRHVWPVSTARRGKVTPRGSYRPQSLVRMHYSTLYNWAPMPYSIFFHGNYAIHGTTEIQHLGRPASAGCVRLHPDNARVLYELIKERGLANAQIVVTG